MDQLSPRLRFALPFTYRFATVPMLRRALPLRCAVPDIAPRCARLVSCSSFVIATRSHHTVCLVIAPYRLFLAYCAALLLYSGLFWLYSLFCRDFLAVPYCLPAFRCATLIVSRLPLVAIYAQFVLPFLVCRDFLTYYDKLFSLLNG